MTRTLHHLLEVIGLVLLGATLASGMILGGGVSAVARSIFLLLAAITFLAAVGAMLFTGTWRFVRSPLWLIVGALFAWSVCQMLPGAGAFLGSAGSSTSTLSTSPHATMQMTLFGGGVLLLIVAATFLLRRADQCVAVTMGLAVVLGSVGILGTFQVLTSRPKLLGFVSADDPRLPAVIADIYSLDSAAGLVAYRPWEASLIAHDTEMFIPQASMPRFFGTFLDVHHWTACVVALLPLVLGCCVYLGRTNGTEVWQSTNSSAGMLSWSLYLFVVGAAFWWGDPIIVPMAVAAGWVVMLLVISPIDRSRLFKFGALSVVVLGGLSALSVWIRGWPDFSTRAERWMMDARSFLVMLQDHLWTGTGIGTTHETWFSYRTEPASVLASGSSVLAAAAELGAVGIGIVALGSAYVLLRTLWSSRRFTDDSRMILAGSLAGVVCTLFFCLAGPGLDLPVVIGLVAFLSALLMRALANGFHDQEALNTP